MAQPTTAIPIIDLSKAADPSKRPDLIRELHEAITTIGFLYISNHGVPEHITADLTALLPALFSLADKEKDAVALKKSPHFLGYSAAGSETTAGATDRREQFDFATELLAPAAPGGDSGWQRLHGPNQWPATLSTVRPAVEAYLSALTGLAGRFLRLVEAALGLPDGRLDAFVGSQHRLKLVRYPPSARGTQGVGPHKDSSGWWTFLLQASTGVGGLEVRAPDGTWAPVPPVDGTFVVNIGQAFEVVSGGRCRATVHRVVGDGSERERYSVPFFHGVRGDLTREEAVGGVGGLLGEGGAGEVDSAWLRGDCDSWGEWQLRTKIRSHRDNGRLFYTDVFAKYVDQEE